MLRRVWGNGNQPKKMYRRMLADAGLYKIEQIQKLIKKIERNWVEESQEKEEN